MSTINCWIHKDNPQDDANKDTNLPSCGTNYKTLERKSKIMKLIKDKQERNEKKSDYKLMD